MPEKFLNGKLKVLQSRKGYRFSLDSVLLAYFIDEPKENRLIDLGTGCGIIPLILAGTRGYRNITGMEIQDSLVSYAERSVALNKLEGKIKIFHDDFVSFAENKSGKKFDAVLSNPPYKKTGTGKINPDEEKAVARHEIKCTIGDVVRSAAALTIKHGSLYVIYHPLRFEDLIAELKANDFHIERFKTVHSRPAQQAQHLLVKAVKNSTKETVVEPPLYVRNEKNEYTPNIKKILGLSE